MKPGMGCELSGAVPNIIRVIEARRTRGNTHSYQLYNSAKHSYYRRFNDFKVCHYHCFQTSEKRVTKVATHPSKFLAVSGSKAGSMSLSDINGPVKELYSWRGKGPGNSILDCKFPYHIDNRMLTASLDGTIKLWDIKRLGQEPLSTLLDTNDYLRWYCSVAPSPSNGITIAGQSNGSITLLDKDFKVISTMRAHKKKVNSIDFNSNSSCLFATGSLDSTVKLYDVRKLDPNGLDTLIHLKPVNSAVFSKMNGHRLLTTDQHSEIRVYQGPLWSLERIIVHPHRQFQHLTPIRASWHPQLDLIVVGRYPDSKLEGFPHIDLRSIDIINANTGELKCELMPSSVRPIITSLAEFSHTGDVLVTGSSSMVSFWLMVNSSNHLKITTNQMDSTYLDSEEVSTNIKKKSSSILKKK